MARPKADLPPADAVRALIDGEGRLSIRVTPGARIAALEVADGRLLAKVRAKPEDGKANEAVIELVAAALGVGASRVRLLRGGTSREKMLAVEG